MSIPKLSEALRLGTTMYPPVHGPVWKKDREGNMCACAVGTPALVIGYLVPERYLTYIHEGMFSAVNLIIENWPWTKKRIQCVECPVDAPVPHWMIHMFEGHRWSRERIADVLETIEPQDSPTATKEPACESALNVSR